MGPGNTATLRTLYEIGHTLRHADAICRHCRWDEEYPLLVPNMADFPIGQVSQDTEPISPFSLPIVAMKRETRPLLEEASRIHERLRCAPSHGVQCLCPASTHWGAVKSCPRCHTDFAVSIMLSPVQHEMRCFVFTTWKYLGSGSQNCYWRSHTDKIGLPLREHQPGSIYHGYEVEREKGRSSQTT
ncbi:hypothetical protein B0T25DRAFT_545684 [Lasiosphaeria hispida]|uniref:Uncharacterized protein n=1 Tax=Lasiosphaeria hispida TaxID=260671 RepID=A0AAJ0MF71_9PEZI|nr:hypothetical protein B0T25DRAFT_545684 [Lasiosphaeria hispida]